MSQSAKMLPYLPYLPSNLAVQTGRESTIKMFIVIIRIYRRPLELHSEERRPSVLSLPKTEKSRG